MAYVELPHSHRPANPAARRLGEVSPDAAVELTVALRGPPLPHADDMDLEPVSREAMQAAYGAAPADAEAVVAVLTRLGFEVEEVSLATRSIPVRGTAAQAEAAFGTKLALYSSADQGDYRGREGGLSIPAELAGLVTGVFGLDERRIVRPRAAKPKPTPAAGVQTPTAPVTPADLERMYNFPQGDGAGAQIVIAEFGGGYFAEDLAAFCARQGRPVPKVSLAATDGAAVPTSQDVSAMPPNQRSAVLSASVEVMMDVEIVGGLCPGAEIFVYFAPVSQKGAVDLLDAIIKGEPAKPVAVCISWGFAEDSGMLSAAAVQAINQKLQALAMMGVTVCVAAGDDGSGAQMADGKAHVDFPASSPFVLGVGGTMLTAAGQEVVWWDAPGRRTGQGGGAGGGGVSEVFARPAWQAVQVASINPGAIDGRVVPDVAGLAGAPSYGLTFLGQPFTSSGTSAAAPVWAALVARMSQQLPAGKQQRFVTRLLYEATSGGTVGSAGCRPVTSGDNASHPQPGTGYAAGPGFSAVAGWGAPDGQALLGALAAV